MNLEIDMQQNIQMELDFSATSAGEAREAEGKRLNRSRRRMDPEAQPALLVRGVLLEIGHLLRSGSSMLDPSGRACSTPTRWRVPSIAQGRGRSCSTLRTPTSQGSGRTLPTRRLADP